MIGQLTHQSKGKIPYFSWPGPPLALSDSPPPRAPLVLIGYRSGPAPVAGSGSVRGLSRAAAAAASGSPGWPWRRGRWELSRLSRRRRWAACPEEPALSAPWKKQRPPAPSAWPVGGCAPSRQRRRGAGTSATPHRPVRPRPRGGIPDPFPQPAVTRGVSPRPGEAVGAPPPSARPGARGPREMPEAGEAAPGRDEPERLVQAVRQLQLSPSQLGRSGIHQHPCPRRSPLLIPGVSPSFPFPEGPCHSLSRPSPEDVPSLWLPVAHVSWCPPRPSRPVPEPFRGGAGGRLPPGLAGRAQPLPQLPAQRPPGHRQPPGPGSPGPQVRPGPHRPRSGGFQQLPVTPAVSPQPQPAELPARLPVPAAPAGPQRQQQPPGAAAPQPGRPPHAAAAGERRGPPWSPAGSGWSPAEPRFAPQDVGCNRLRALPPGLGQLRALRDLNVRRNQLAALPEGG